MKRMLIGILVLLVCGTASAIELNISCGYTTMSVEKINERYEQWWILTTEIEFLTARNINYGYLLDIDAVFCKQGNIGIGVMFEYFISPKISYSWITYPSMEKAFFDEYLSCYAVALSFEYDIKIKKFDIRFLAAAGLAVGEYDFLWYFPAGTLLLHEMFTDIAPYLNGGVGLVFNVNKAMAINLLSVNYRYAYFPKLEGGLVMDGLNLSGLTLKGGINWIF